MNALKLCDAVNWQIQLSGMKSEDAQVIKTCIARYTCKEGIGEKIKYLFNRVCNAVKGVFGQSDWQRAEKVIANHVYSYIPFFCREFIKNKTQAQVHYLAEKSLQFLVWENKQNLELPQYAKTFTEGQLKLVNRAVSKVALDLFQRANLFGLAMLASFSNKQMNGFIQFVLAQAVSKMNLAQQQNFSLALIQGIIARCLHLPSSSPQLTTASQ